VNIHYIQILQQRFIVIFSIAAFVISFNRLSAQTSRISKVVIDAGHGGHDPGCIGSKTKEKDVTLSVALKLGYLIEKNFPEVKVVFTRKTDVFVELFKRAQIANDGKADLFISIHCNANPSKTPLGVETYVMGLHKTKANLEVAQKENASILMEDSYTNNYDGFEPGSSEAYIIFSLFQNAHLDHSLFLATHVQKQLIKKTGMTDRGIKQAGFLVLYKTAMPSILIETGFLSNIKDEEIIGNNNGQELLSQSIFLAFKTYKSEMEGSDTISKSVDLLIPDSLKNKVALIDTVKLNNDSSSTKLTKNEIIFKVQFATSSVKKSLTSPDFKGIKDVQSLFQNNIYKYVAGNETNPEDATKLLEKIRKLGFKDAFLIAFLNGEKISPQEAMKLIKKKY